MRKNWNKIEIVREMEIKIEWKRISFSLKVREWNFKIVTKYSHFSVYSAGDDGVPELFVVISTDFCLDGGMMAELLSHRMRSFHISWHFNKLGVWLLLAVLSANNDIPNWK